MTIQAIIWDLGGVIARTEDPTPRQKLASRLNTTPKELIRLFFFSQSALQATLGQITSRQHQEAVRSALGLSNEEFLPIWREFWAGDEVDKELVDFIRNLRPRYKTALLSNAWDNLREVLSKHWRIDDAFDEMVISSEVGIAKPDPRIYQLMLDKLRLSPDQTVFIDDFPENIEAAQTLGMQAILFHSREQAIADLRKRLNQHLSS